MKTSEYIAVTIDRLPKGYVFTYAGFVTEVNRREAIIKALNRLALEYSPATQLQILSLRVIQYQQFIASFQVKSRCRNKEQAA